MKNTIDPTENVKELVELSIKRLDDLAAVRSYAREKYVDDKFHDKDVQYQIQFNTAKETVSAALDWTKEAINKADTNTDKRFSLLSEKIDGITDTMNKSTGERGIYVTHSDLSNETEKIKKAFEEMIRPVVTFMNSMTGQEKQSNLIWVYMLGISGIIISVIHILLSFSEK